MEDPIASILTQQGFVFSFLSFTQSLANLHSFLFFQRFVVVDGGLATELERLGANINGSIQHPPTWALMFVS